MSSVRRGRSRSFPGRVRASSQRYFQLRDEGIISSAEEPCSSRSRRTNGRNPPEKKGSDMQAPFTTTIFPSRDWARRPRICQGTGGECSRCPERAPPCWEIILAARASFASRKAFRARDRADRLGLASAWGAWGGVLDVSPRRYSQLLQDDGSVGACSGPKSPAGPPIAMFATAGAVFPVFLSWTGRREASRFALRAAYAVSPCLSDVSGVGEAGEVEIVKPGFAADRAQAAPRRREHGRGVPVEDDLGPQRKRGVFSARCSWRVENPRGLSEFAFLRRSEKDLDGGA